MNFTVDFTVTPWYDILKPREDPRQYIIGVK